MDVVISAGPQPPSMSSSQIMAPTISSGPQPPSMPQGILQPPQPMPGIVRSLGQVGPPQGMMFMQGIPGQMRPLLGMPPQPGYPPFGMPPGGMPRPPLLTPGMPPNLMGQPPMMQMPDMDDEPSSKRAKSAEDALIPEAQFLASCGPSSTFSVAIPDKPELNLKGKLISFSMSLTDSVGTLKSKINEVIGLGPGKQKLSRDGLFYKDQNTLAYYNIGDGSVVLLSLKERGGRKK